jgi:hypothetical protein
MFESFHSHDNLPMDKLLLNMSHKDEQTLDFVMAFVLQGFVNGGQYFRPGEVSVELTINNTRL